MESENQNKSYIKMAIISSIAVLLILLIVYFLFIALRENNNPEVANNITSTLTYKLPTSTPIPTPDNKITLYQNNKDDDSPLDQRLYDFVKEKEVFERPDIIVSNSTPYNNNYFLANTEFVQAQPAGYFKLIIYPTTGDESKTDEEVSKWLSSLGLPPESIAKLVIEKRPLAKEMRNL